MQNRFFHQSKFSMGQWVFVLNTQLVTKCQVDTIGITITVQSDGTEKVTEQYHVNVPGSNINGWYNAVEMFETAAEIYKKITRE